ncbi:hypothetical protein [Brevifollis gellanilyticus]|uniref:Uncharacterized protein n=1 Tax=Brevifollis gellanilyticus TaxID=748831 RepID=A0A512M5N0_9BACT|nr:hypothetical protein [Brevifollis gellanilyticus]GEP42039.1 hypothetical protein BGE01nite_13300 [Brevifollis gellanilyticus]
MKRYLRFEMGLALAIILGWLVWDWAIFPHTERGRAWTAVHKLGEGVIAFRSAKGHWPKTLADLGQPGLLAHEGTPFVYDPKAPSIMLPMEFKTNWFKRTFTSRQQESNYGMNLASVWKHRNP